MHRKSATGGKGATPGVVWLTDADCPGAFTPRKVVVSRSGLVVGSNPAVVAAVAPPLQFDGPVDSVVLASRTRVASIADILALRTEFPTYTYASM